MGIPSETAKLILSAALYRQQALREAVRSGQQQQVRSERHNQRDDTTLSNLLTCHLFGCAVESGKPKRLDGRAVGAGRRWLDQPSSESLDRRSALPEEPAAQARSNLPCATSIDRI